MDFIKAACRIGRRYTIAILQHIEALEVYAEQGRWSEAMESLGTIVQNVQLLLDLATRTRNAGSKANGNMAGRGG